MIYLIALLSPLSLFFRTPRKIVKETFGFIFGKIAVALVCLFTVAMLIGLLCTPPFGWFILFGMFAKPGEYPHGGIDEMIRNATAR